MGKLVIIATPIGNLDDLTYRAARVLGEVDALACEDTRMTRKIYERYNIASPRTIFSYHEHNEDQAGKRIMGLLESGLSVGLCTDSGLPGISDPGYRIVADALAAGHELEVLPGASAATTALIASGLPSASFTFKGFPPRKSGPRQRFLEPEAALPHTLVFFESPHRVHKFLVDAVIVLGDRQAAVCIELTKKFEEVHRGYLRDLVGEFEDVKVRGEVTVVIAGNHPKFIRAEAPEMDT
ncbi:MAG: 16S rRNA (cytidine(1402)-2'-O)-methyltransferase [Candidatus Hydrogenedentales bacterium]